MTASIGLVLFLFFFFLHFTFFLSILIDPLHRRCSVPCAVNRWSLPVSCFSGFRYWAFPEFILPEPSTSRSIDHRLPARLVLLVPVTDPPPIRPPSLSRAIRSPVLDRWSLPFVTSRSCTRVRPPHDSAATPLLSPSCWFVRCRRRRRRRHPLCPVSSAEPRLA